MDSLLWHDYETFGTDPARDRVSQFAGIRTDRELNILGDPVSFYCQPAEDSLPHPMACLITGITPQQCHREGLPEFEFVQRIQDELGRSGTCGVGYNSIRFDDEVTRHMLFRNLRDPYAREWQNGNSRWDLIDVVRLAYATRPEGLEWPLVDGVPSFRLEVLTEANHLSHEAAHDALSDVEATIALARLLRDKQPKLYEYAYGLRRKAAVREQLKLGTLKPVFHVSSKIPARLGCCALVVPLAEHPSNPNAVLAIDLRYNPAELATLTAEEIRERVFRSAQAEEEGMERIPLKAIHLNRSPIVTTPQMVASISEDRRRQFGLDGDLFRKHLASLRGIADLPAKIQAVYAQPLEDEEMDPEFSLYSGSFLSDADRRLCNQILQMPSDDLAEQVFPFEDERLATLLFRYRARNFPETLSEAEMSRWEHYRYEKLSGALDPKVLNFEAYFQELQRLASEHAQDPKKMQLLEELHLYGESLVPGV